MGLHDKTLDHLYVSKPPADVHAVLVVLTWPHHESASCMSLPNACHLHHMIMDVNDEANVWVRVKVHAKPRPCMLQDCTGSRAACHNQLNHFCRLWLGCLHMKDSLACLMYDCMCIYVCTCKSVCVLFILVISSGWLCIVFTHWHTRRFLHFFVCKILSTR